VIAVTPVDQTRLDCPRCGTSVPIPEPEDLPQAEAYRIPVHEDPGPAERITALDLEPVLGRKSHATEPPARDVKINLGSGGEFCVVLALLLPVIVQCIFLFRDIDSVAVEFALVFGTVVVTAILLGIDAASMGRIDLNGQPREGVGGVVAGVILLWFIFYPAAFFRRRHFGRPNFGVLAVVVAVIFAGGRLVPNLREILPGGAPLPSCTAPEVTRAVDDLLHKSLVGPSIKSIRGYRETDHDRSAGLRKGECTIETESGSTPVRFQVKWGDAYRRMFHVSIEPFVPPDPPSCTCAEVIGMVDSIVKTGLPGFNTTRVDGHREIRYDRASKTRYGQCTAQAVTGPISVSYTVQWADAAKGSFHVGIVP
jgi:hypothetical protein